MAVVSLKPDFLREITLRQSNWARKNVVWLFLAILGLAALASVAIFSRRADETNSQERIVSFIRSHLDMRTWAMVQQCNTAQIVGEKHKDTQLSDAMMFWIADALHSAQYTNAPEADLLVFGLGNDSPTWNDINCNGRTVFVEDSEEWFHSVLTRSQGLEAYLYHYNTTLQEAQEFFDNPFIMEIDASVDEECFDVMLIDAPMGFDSSKPGRMAPAYYALQRARECVLQEERKNVIFVFMHDMERIGEQQIAETYFAERNGWIQLGEVADDADRKLRGWAMVKM